MSLKTAIKFRYLAAQLTHTETRQFVEKLLNEPNNIIITALFSYFLQSLQRNHAEMINNLLSKIIRSRKDKPKTITTQTIKLDHLPKPLIGVTASFLTQCDYINLSKTNRYIYLGCNSPNSLQKLDISNIKNYSYLNLALYPSVKTLRLNINKFHELAAPNPGSLIMRGLKSVALEANKQTNCNIHPFISQNWINMSNVSHLICETFGELPCVKFTKLLTKFPNIQYLSLVGVICSDIDSNQIKQIYPNLRGLDCMVSPDINNRFLIHTFGDQLERLLFAQLLEDTHYDLSFVDFRKLQHLKLFTPSTKSINDILKTAANLTKMLIRINETVMTTQEIKEVIITILRKCKLLKCIRICLSGKSIKCILEGLEKALFQTKKRKRKELIICIQREINDEIKLQDFTLNIGHIIHWLEKSKIDDFMFMIRNKNKKIDDGFIEELEDLSSNIKVYKYESQLVITNTNCHINGYNESLEWIG